MSPRVQLPFSLTCWAHSGSHCFNLGITSVLILHFPVSVRRRLAHTTTMATATAFSTSLPHLMPHRSTSFPSAAATVSLPVPSRTALLWLFSIVSSCYSSLYGGERGRATATSESGTRRGLNPSGSRPTGCCYCAMAGAPRVAPLVCLGQVRAPLDLPRFKLRCDGGTGPCCSRRRWGECVLAVELLLRWRRSVAWCFCWGQWRGSLVVM